MSETKRPKRRLEVFPLRKDHGKTMFWIREFKDNTLAQTWPHGYSTRMNARRAGRRAYPTIAILSVTATNQISKPGRAGKTAEPKSKAKKATATGQKAQAA